MRNAFMQAIFDACERREDLMILSGDAGLGVFDDFQKRHPDRFLNLGVAEQNMVSFAAGLSLAGFKPILYNIIPVLMYRGYEQIRNDICYQKLPVILAGIGSGLTYAPQGMTHYSLEDIGLGQTLPNLTILSPMDPLEAKMSAGYAMEAGTPVYVRLPKRGEPTFHERDFFDISKPQILRPGSEIAILFHGSIAEEVFRAHEELVRAGIHPMIISLPMVQPLDPETLLEILQGVKTVICVEEHYENCGLGNILARFHAKYEPGWRLETMGVPHRFIHEVLDTRGMREYCGLSSSHISAAVRSRVGGKRLPLRLENRLQAQENMGG